MVVEGEIAVVVVVVVVVAEGGRNMRDVISDSREAKL